LVTYTLLVEIVYSVVITYGMFSAAVTVVCRRSVTAVVTFWITLSIPVGTIWSGPAIVTLTFSQPVTMGVGYTLVTKSLSWSSTCATIVFIVIMVGANWITVNVACTLIAIVIGVHLPDSWLTDTISINITLGIWYTASTIRVVWSSTSVTT
jgi:hypothetical protein